MAGSKPQPGNSSSASGKRAAIQIDADFSEKPSSPGASQQRGAGRRAGAYVPDSSSLPTTGSKAVFWGIVGAVIGLPVLVTLVLVLQDPDDVNRYPIQRANEARAHSALIIEHAKSAYARGVALPAAPSLSDLGLTETRVRGEYGLTYELSYSPPALTVIVQDVFLENPRELVTVINLDTGSVNTNR
ncbi:hypothetical protein EDM80_05745 [bacterium]|nr:MAG: hypothetical protein EDM80_05745 [bacterium]RIK62892.1 MAG: hypothetical protein DCC64_08675 [Planctomycetota bacterium]